MSRRVDPKQIPITSPKEETVWLKNPHGVVVALPKSLADWRLRTSPGFAKCESEYVPEEKEYPDDIMLNEAGNRRRKLIRDKREAKAEGAVGPGMGAEPKAEGVTPEKKLEEGLVLTKEEYRELSWADLRKYAATRGLHDYKLKKDELLEKLDNVHL